MRAFIDFEASSLGKAGTPIEVAWVFEDGRSETHLIRPAPGWDDWDAAAEAIHHISRETLVNEGAPHDVVARRMVEVLGGHELFASAPSWDGKWLSALLRAAGLPRHALRLRDTEEAQREIAREVLRNVIPAQHLAQAVGNIVVLAEFRCCRQPPSHRALPDAEGELALWTAVRDAAREEAAERALAGPAPVAAEA